MNNYQKYSKFSPITTKAKLWVYDDLQNQGHFNWITNLIKSQKSQFFNTFFFPQKQYLFQQINKQFTSQPITNQKLQPLNYGQINYLIHLQEIVQMNLVLNQYNLLAYENKRQPIIFLKNNNVYHKPQFHPHLVINKTRVCQQKQLNDYCFKNNQFWKHDKLTKIRQRANLLWLQKSQPHPQNFLVHVRKVLKNYQFFGQNPIISLAKYSPRQFKNNYGQKSFPWIK